MGGPGHRGRPCPCRLACAVCLGYVPRPWACMRMGAIVCRPAAGAMAPAPGHSCPPWGPCPGIGHPAPGLCCHTPEALPPGPVLLTCLPARAAALVPAPREATHRAGGFYAPGLVSRRSKLYAPYNPPNTAFCTENHPRILSKKLPHVPPLGGLGNGFGPIDAAKMCRYHPGQANATAARCRTFRITAAPRRPPGPRQKISPTGNGPAAKNFRKKGLTSGTNECYALATKTARMSATQARQADRPERTSICVKQ